MERFKDIAGFVALLVLGASLGLLMAPIMTVAFFVGLLAGAFRRAYKAGAYVATGKAKQ